MRACGTRRVAAIGSLILLVAAPAEAHDPGGGRNTGSCGQIDTILAGTLAEGQIAAAPYYEFIRLDQLDHTTLLAAAEQGKDGHSIRSIENVSLSAAYRITNDFTVAIRFPHARCSDPARRSSAVFARARQIGMPR